MKILMNHDKVLTWENDFSGYSVEFHRDDTWYASPKVNVVGLTYKRSALMSRKLENASFLKLLYDLPWSRKNSLSDREEMMDGKTSH
jgi:hypothetical protein